MHVLEIGLAFCVERSALNINRLALSLMLYALSFSALRLWRLKPYAL